MEVLNAVQQHFLKALPEYIALAGLFLVSVIANQPLPEVIAKWLGAFKEIPPGAKFRKVASQKFRDLLAILYKWQYDSLQAFMSARNPAGAHTIPPPPQYVLQQGTQTVIQTPTTVTPNDPNASVIITTPDPTKSQTAEEKHE